MPDNEELSTEVKDSPVHLRGDLSRPPSRALWLLKWLMAFPHIIVLTFLSIAVFFVGIIVFFAIVFTGRYPRRLFNFVVGVFRWGWRVGFYAFSVLGTDKYPPFSLKPREDYPADLHIDYSERLSQWMPLVKWFLAIPHFLVLSALVGSSVSFDDKEKLQNSFSIVEVRASDMEDAPVLSLQNFLPPESRNFFDKDEEKNETYYALPGLLGVLILIALIGLLFTGRYHTDIFRLVMGINRWSYRAVAYVFLLTDRYPHFRLMD